MMIRKFIAAAVFTVAATGITAATGYGSPALPTTAVNGVDAGIGYSGVVAPDGSSATVTLAAGRFELTSGAGVNVLAPDGQVIGSIPTTVQSVAGQSVQVAPAVDAAATTLTLTPVGGVTPEPVALQNIGDAGSTIAGAAIGCVIGVLIGVWFFGIGAIVGCIIGAVVGGIIGQNQ